MTRAPSRLLPLAWLAFAPAALSAQGKEKDPPPVDQEKVDAAVAKGAEWLRARLKEGLPSIKETRPVRDHSLNEIVLYTLLHAGVHRGDPALLKLVSEIRAKPPAHTYGTALRAMAFSLYDPVKLRPDLVQCMEFLVNNQGQNGQWGYGNPIELPPLPKVTFTPSSEPPKYTLTGSGATGGADAPGTGTPAGPASGKPANPGSTEARHKPPRTQTIRRQWGQPADNSNTQYAMLGLRACMGEGILPPADCLQLAEEWWRAQQNDDGGWAYKSRGAASTGAMTTGGVSSLAVCLRGTGGRPLLQDPAVAKALQWLGARLRFNENPANKEGWSDYYWIYAVERAGALAGTEWFGDHAWYPEGVAWILAHQLPGGFWDGDMYFVDQGTNANDILDTCWAMLFLRRATRHIAQKRIIYTQ